MGVDVIAIDGPSASGKSTVARRVAHALGWLYVDSGAVYRGVTWQVLRGGANPDEAAAVSAVAEALPITFFAEQGAVCFEVDGCRPGEALRTEAVNAAVSLVAAVPEVRARVVAWLRAMRRFGRLVMEGRDIGTVVFPDTACKFYLDASPGERARRRFLEEGGGEPRSVEQVSASLSRRDRIDSSRQTAPLRRADGAVVIDSTGMRVDDVVAAVLRHAADAGVREASRP